ncbi:MAG: flagellar protein FlaG [Nitrospirales bacterium]
MISTISQNTSIISVSVGHEVRVRDSQKAGDVESFRVKKEKDAERKESIKLEESQNSKTGPEQVEEVVSRLQNALQNIEPRIELSVDKELNQVIVRVFDEESGDLIRQIPSEEILKLDRFFDDLSGLFVEEEI